MFKFPVIELVDRYAIARVKYLKTKGANSEELAFYTMQLKDFDAFDRIQVWLTALEDLHRSIWNLEDDFKKCKLDNVDLAEIGRRALEIRDFNNLRIQMKNHMAKLLGDPVREIKNG